MPMASPYSSFVPNPDAPFGAPVGVPSVPFGPPMPAETPKPTTAPSVFVPGLGMMPAPFAQIPSLASQYGQDGPRLPAPPPVTAASAAGPPMPGPSTAGPAAPTSAHAAYQGVQGAGGLGSAPMPPPRPADLTPAPAAPAASAPPGSSLFPVLDDRGYTTWQGTPASNGQSTPSGASSAPAGSGLVQGPGQPGEGLTTFLKNLFGGGSHPGQGNVLGNTGGTDSKPIYSGDPQSSLPSWMKGSSLANFLQMLGVGGM